jgi:hypothetical protein
MGASWFKLTVWSTIFAKKGGETPFATTFRTGVCPMMQRAGARENRAARRKGLGLPKASACANNTGASLSPTPMKTLSLLAVGLLWSFAGFNGSADAAGAIADPADLIAARARYESALKPLQDKASNAIKARAAKYAIELHDAERQAVGDGKVDSLATAHAEFEAYASGSGTIGFAEGDSKVSAPVRELRRFYDRDIQKINMDFAVEAKPAFDSYMQALEELEKKFVAARDPDGLLAVQKEKKATQPTSLDPLNRGGRAIVGEWIDQSSAKFTFHEDGTVATSVQTHGTWAWDDVAKRKMTLIWDGGNKGKIEYTVLPDGLAMVGRNQKNESKTLTKSK